MKRFENVMCLLGSGPQEQDLVAEDIAALPIQIFWKSKFSCKVVCRVQLSLNLWTWGPMSRAIPVSFHLHLIKSPTEGPVSIHIQWLHCLNEIVQASLISSPLNFLHITVSFIMFTVLHPLPLSTTAYKVNRAEWYESYLSIVYERYLALEGLKHWLSSTARP